MNYRFHSYDYLILILSYVLAGLFVADTFGTIALPDIVPAWSYLVLAFALNLWVIPVPGIHPRTISHETGVEQIKEKTPEKPAEITAGKSLEQGLAQTHKGFIERISAVFRSSNAMDADTLSSLEETLVGTDIGIKTAYMLFENVQKKAKEIQSPQQSMEIIKDEILSILQKRQDPLVIPNDKKPFVIMVTGVNGSGKTTTIAKIARRLINDGLSVVIASGDTFRAAAIEQLEHWADKVGADFVRAQEGQDPTSVAFDGLQAAIARGHDVLIIDTAGRLHTKENLMDELQKTKKVLDKKLPGAPHETLLVLDASIGQNAIEQTRQFNTILGVTGIVLTKLDGSAKGGVIVGIANEFEIPIRLVGIGESMDDLQVFNAAEFTNALFMEE